MNSNCHVPARLVGVSSHRAFVGIVVFLPGQWTVDCHLFYM